MVKNTSKNLGYAAYNMIKNRKRVSKKRMRMLRAGAKYIPDADRGNLSIIWNNIFFKKAQSKLVGRFNPQQLNPKKTVFVIDMQNDFLDMPYIRGENDGYNPVFGKDEKKGGGLKAIGNFPVAGGSTMIDDMKTKIKEALSDKNCERIIFSRDYHPRGHISFNKTVFYDKRLCGECENNDGGVFPAHCVQGTKGSLFRDEIAELLKTHEIKEELEKVSIVFKGVHLFADSFTAFPKEEIDSIASNYFHRSCKGCSSVSGGYTLYNGETVATLIEAIDFNEELSLDTFKSSVEGSNFSLRKEDYNTLLKSSNTIEVCGLAGDYCVRDTIIALAEKYKEKKIVLLGDLTRYAALPLKSVAAVPQHVSKAKYLDPNYTFSFNPGRVEEFLDKAKLTGNIEDYSLSLDESSTTPEGSRLEKDIVYYLLRFNIETKEFSLLKKEELESVTLDMVNGENTFATIQHFITPSEEIIADYADLKNVYIDIRKTLKV